MVKLSRKASNQHEQKKDDDDASAMRYGWLRQLESNAKSF